MSSPNKKPDSIMFSSAWLVNDHIIVVAPTIEEAIRKFKLWNKVMNDFEYEIDSIKSKPVLIDA